MVSKQQADLCRSLVRKTQLQDTPVATSSVVPTVPQHQIAAAAAISVPSFGESVVVNEQNQQEAMITSLSQSTGMKRNWSRKYVKTPMKYCRTNFITYFRCLEDSDWKFETAKFAFDKYRSAIPPEAFEGH